MTCAGRIAPATQIMTNAPMQKAIHDSAYIHVVCRIVRVALSEERWGDRYRRFCASSVASAFEVLVPMAHVTVGMVPNSVLHCCLPTIRFPSHMYKGSKDVKIAESVNPPIDFYLQRNCCFHHYSFEENQLFAYPIRSNIRWAFLGNSYLILSVINNYLRRLMAVIWNIEIKFESTSICMSWYYSKCSCSWRASRPWIYYTAGFLNLGQFFWVIFCQ